MIPFTDCVFLFEVTRSTQYTDPPMQHVMNMIEFQSELGEMSVFNEMQKDKSEDEVVKILGDNPFLPCNLETCAGRAQFTLQSKVVSDEPVSIPIVQNQSRVGRIKVQLVFKFNGKPLPSPVNLDDIVPPSFLFYKKDQNHRYWRQLYEAEISLFKVFLKKDDI